MQSKAKSNSVVTTRLLDTGVIEFTVLKAAADGVGAATMTLDPKACSEPVRARAVVHGLVARVVDRAALDRNKTTGKSASGAEKFAAMKTLVDHYASGAESWAMAQAERAPRGPSLDPIILAAVSEATGRGAVEVLEMVTKGAAGKAITLEAYLAALAASIKVAPIVAWMRAEAAAGLDGDALLNEAMGGGEGGEEERESGEGEQGE